MNYYSWYKYKNKKASNQNRLGDFELMFFNSKQTLEKNPKEKDIKSRTRKHVIFLLISQRYMFIM